MRRRSVYALKRWRTRRQRPNRFRWAALILGAGFGLFLGSVALAGIVAYAGSLAYNRIVDQLAAPETIVQRTGGESTKIYDRNGTFLYEIFDPRGGRRTRIPLRDIPLTLRQATIATEDADFYRNQGFSLRGIARAAWQNLRAGRTVEGGSTITQQLAKNVLIPQEERTQQSLVRKIQELVIAVQLTQITSKDKILETYLNEISYGNLAYGVEAAAQSYFGKSARDLDLAESAMLAGIPQSPAIYSPVIDPQAAKRRQAQVLDLMVRHGYISADQAEAAKNERLHFAPQRFPIRAPHFVMYVREILAATYGREELYHGGLRVRTSIDLEMQDKAESIIAAHRAELRKLDATNAALVAINPKTGEILAMVGSADFFDPAIDGQVNVALTARQPGATMLSLTYAAALGKGWTPATIVLDVPSSSTGSRLPVSRNGSQPFRGPVSVRQALAQSLNVPAQRALQFVGASEIAGLAQKMGMTTLDLSVQQAEQLALGQRDVKLLDLVYAYTVFANGGAIAGRSTGSDAEGGTMEPVGILSVVDGRGRTLEEFRGPERQPIISPQVAYLVTHVLSDSKARAASADVDGLLKLGNRPVAVKTSDRTTATDGWAIGYVPSLAAGVWVGNPDYSLIRQEGANAGAGAIWHDFMERALGDVPPEPFAVPAGIEDVKVCADSGLLPSSLCGDRVVTEVFIKGTAPTRVDDQHQMILVDKATGKPATSQTPTWRTERRVALVLPPEAAEWAKTADRLYVIPKAPEPTDTGRPHAEVEITRPTSGSEVAGAVPIMGSATGGDFQSYRVEVGQGQHPTDWTPIKPDDRQSVPYGLLTTWNTVGLTGQYTIRLTVLGTSGRTRDVSVPVVVDNTPPTVQLTTPKRGDVARESGGWVTLEAQASDDVGIARVDFVGDGQFIGTSAKAPYRTFWTIGPGDHAIQVYAYDRAGNRASSEVVPIHVKEG